MTLANDRSAAQIPTVILMEGGGALGAYMAGVWRVLAPWLPAPPLAIAGSSIGALNAALIVRNLWEPDRGVGALERFWREEVATDSIPFTAPWLAGFGARVDGLLTGMLAGTRGLHRAAPLHWHPMAGMARVLWPLTERSRMADLVERLVGRLAGQEPWLGVAAVDVLGGRLRLFDSDSGGIGVPELLASSAVPIVYEPVEIDGTLYWDGDITRDSMLIPVLDRLRSSGRLKTGRPLRLITVSLRPRKAASRPISSTQLSWRMLELLMHGKLDHEEARRAGVPDAIVICRSSLPGDSLSREFDYSPQRIDELIAQGVREATEALSRTTAGAAIAGPRDT